MNALLVKWIMLGITHTMSVQHVPETTCTALAAEALNNPNVQAVLCTRDGLKVNDAVNIGACVDVPEDATPTSRTYICNGRIPTWN